MIDTLYIAQIHKAVVGVAVSLLLFNGCVADKSISPNSGEKTAAKKAPDFTQKEIHTTDGHIIKLEGKDGSGFVRSYKNNKKDGITAMYQNGVLYAEKSYKNGILHGLSKNYYAPLTLLDVTYVDGKKHGLAIEWCDGRKELKVREHYNHGTLDGRQEKWICNKQHNPSSSIEYKNGKLDGLYITYHSGILQSEDRYKDDKRDGVSKRYHNSGKLCCLTTYKNGILHGENKFWDHLGDLRKDVMYIDGRAFDKDGNFIPKIKEKN